MTIKTTVWFKVPDHINSNTELIGLVAGRVSKVKECLETKYREDDPNFLVTHTEVNAATIDWKEWRTDWYVEVEAVFYIETTINKIELPVKEMEGVIWVNTFFTDAQSPYTYTGWAHILQLKS